MFQDKIGIQICRLNKADHPSLRGWGGYYPKYWKRKNSLFLIAELGYWFSPTLTSGLILSDCLHKLNDLKQNLLWFPWVRNPAWFRLVLCSGSYRPSSRYSLYDKHKLFSLIFPHFLLYKFFFFLLHGFCLSRRIKWDDAWKHSIRPNIEKIMLNFNY